MVQFLPVSGYRYDLSQVGALSEVTCPAPSRLDEDLQDDLYRRHPCNAVRLVANRDEPGDSSFLDRCHRAEDFFQIWKKERILRPEHEAAAYFYQQVFLQDGVSCSSMSVIGRIKLSGIDDRSVLTIVSADSELTEERLLLAKTCRSEFSAVHALLMSDTDDTARHALSDFLPMLHGLTPLELTDQSGVIHRLWPASDRAIINRLQQRLTACRAVVVGELEQLEAARKIQAETADSRLPQSRAGSPSDQAAEVASEEAATDYVLMCLTELQLEKEDGSEPIVIYPLPAAVQVPLVTAMSSKDLARQLGAQFVVEPVGNEPHACSDACELAALNQSPAVAVGSVSGEWSIVSLASPSAELEAVVSETGGAASINNARWHVAYQLSKAVSAAGSDFTIKQFERRAASVAAEAIVQGNLVAAGQLTVLIPPATPDEMMLAAMAVAENQHVDPIVGLRLCVAPLSGLVFYSLEH